jgi:hypothetical protein
LASITVRWAMVYMNNTRPRPPTIIVASVIKSNSGDD